MRTIVKGKNVELPERVRTFAERKLGRLERLLEADTPLVLELSNEKHRSATDAHIADVTLAVHGRTMRSQATGATYQAAIDAVVDKVERQAVDVRKKPLLRHRPAEEKTLLRRIADGTADTARERRIVKTKRFAITPMFEEDAAAEMDELGHDFFVFVNAETERIAILYLRGDGDLGLIEPIVGGEYTPGGFGGARRQSAAGVAAPAATSTGTTRR
ncbi:MAG TPA: ribosome-associated translation inhibitor RaiA [Candidatus Limnocylindrales bacterium]|nr:ribosome-associated translation inhibitor RaiA [Candidatus Limnocylindrales bacterium]